MFSSREKASSDLYYRLASLASFHLPCFHSIDAGFAFISLNTSAKSNEISVAKIKSAETFVPATSLQLGCESVFGELGSLGIPSGLSYVISYHWSYTSQQKEDSALGHFLNPQPRATRKLHDRSHEHWAHQQKKRMKIQTYIYCIYRYKSEPPPKQLILFPFGL